MPEITTVDRSFAETVPYGSEWELIAEYYPNLPIKFGCRNAECGVCAFRVVKGAENLTRKGKKEEATLSRKGHSSEFRLACQCAVIGDVCID